MYIHIGNKMIVSDKNLIGIFNSDTIKMSETNKWFSDQLKDDDKSVSIDEKNNIIASKVSPYTVIKRTSLMKDFLWRRDNE